MPAMDIVAAAGVYSPIRHGVNTMTIAAWHAGSDEPHPTISPPSQASLHE
jgi:hypothetical protein